MISIDSANGKSLLLKKERERERDKKKIDIMSVSSHRFEKLLILDTESK